jgi:hypothetical protein
MRALLLSSRNLNLSGAMGAALDVFGYTTTEPAGGQGTAPKEPSLRIMYLLAQV